jgi:hypothetical protein
MMSLRDRALPIALGVAALIVYVAALPPSFAYWDTGELQIVSILLGIEHPPGSPAFVLLGWLFAHAIPFGEPAWRVNLFSSVSVAVSVGFLYATMRRLGIATSISVLCSLGFAFSWLTLMYATRAEVHDLALCFGAAALYFALRYEQERTIRDLFFTAFATGAFAATHGVALFFVPAVALVVVMHPWPASERRAALAAVLGGLVVGLLPYAYIAPRSAWLAAHHVDPTLSVGLPPGLPFWNYGNPSTPQTFWRFVTGAEFHVHSGFAGYVDPLRYPLYGGALVRRLGVAYGYVGTLLAAIGAALLFARRGAFGKALVLAAILAVPYTESYADLQDPDRYYLLALWCAAIGIGVAFERLVALVITSRAAAVRALLAAGLAAIFVFADTSRAKIFNQRNDFGARDYAEFVRNVTPSDAIVLADWAYSSPLAYAAYVQNSFGDRIVAPASATQYADLYNGWLAQKRSLYMVTFDNDLKLPHYTVTRITTDQGFNMYQIRR